MKRAPLVFWTVVAFGLTVAGCDCGGHAYAAGASCGQDNDCESNACGADRICKSPIRDGGSRGSDGGQGSSLDAGGCANLECNVAACTNGRTTTLTGKVYDPGGTVPLYNAIVYVPNGPVKPLLLGATCGPCGSLISGSPVAITITGADGSFTLSKVPSGSNIPMVIQIGKWRRQVILPNVVACQDNPIVDANITRLPRNQQEGDLPRMAISSGHADAFECLLRKIGISDGEFTAPSGTGRVHYYVQNGLDLASGAPAGSSLWSNPATLASYDVVILPCEGKANAKTGAAVKNIVDYTNAGGRVFATHFSYVWTRPGWPQAAGWQPGLPDVYNSVFDATVDQGFPKGQAFAQWLVNVGAGSSLGTLGLLETRHDVVSVNPGSTRWLYGDVQASSPKASIQHLTFNTPFLDAGTLPDGGAAAQCGRVVYSDFHVTAGATTAGGTIFPDSCVAGPLTGQEKALEFMLFDLSACVQDDNQAPSTCGASGSSCQSDAQCCGGLSCAGPNGAACNGAGCACQPSIN